MMQMNTFVYVYLCYYFTGANLDYLDFVDAQRGQQLLWVVVGKYFFVSRYWTRQNRNKLLDINPSSQPQLTIRILACFHEIEGD